MLGNDKLAAAVDVFDDLSSAPNVEQPSVKPKPTPKAKQPEPAPPAPKPEAAPTTARKLPAMPSAYRAAKNRKGVPMRRDPERKKTTWYYPMLQYVALKKIRTRIEELSGVTVDLSDLAAEGIELLLKKYRGLLSPEDPQPNGNPN